MVIAERDLQTQITQRIPDQIEVLEVAQVNGVVREFDQDPETMDLIRNAKQRKEQRLFLTAEGWELRRSVMRTDNKEVTDLLDNYLKYKSK